MFAEHKLDPEGQGTACAVSLTRDTEGAVRRYLGQSGLKLRRLLVARPRPACRRSRSPPVPTRMHRPSSWRQEFVLTVKLARARGKSVFICLSQDQTPSPFYLERQVVMFKPLTPYEFDFGFQMDNSYQPSLAYPKVATVSPAV